MTDPAPSRREWRNKHRSDADLVQATREGDRLAFGVLWDRHAEAARRVARSISWSADPDDLISEAFTRILRATQRGGGPTEAFRPYLFATIKNIAVSWSKDAATVALDDVPEFADESQPDPATLVADRTSLARAFRSLPERWRTVLWYIEVEGMAPRDLAPLLGISANSVAALAYRAREGFRKAWIEAHLEADDRSEECRWVTESVVARRGRKLGKRDSDRLDRHLAECAACRIIVADDRDPSERLRVVLLALTLGGAAGAYTLVHSPPPASAAMVGLKPSLGPVAVVTASIGLVLAVSGSVAALSTIPPSHAPVVVAQPDVRPTETPTEPETTPAPEPSASPSLPPTPQPDPTSPSPSPVLPPQTVPAPVPPPAPRPTPTPTPTPEPTPIVAPAPAVDAPADLDAPVPAPITGTGVPGGIVTALDQDGVAVGTAIVGADGAFALALDTAAMAEGSSIRLSQAVDGMTSSPPTAAIGPFLLPVPGVTAIDGTTTAPHVDADDDGDADDIEVLLSGIAGAHMIVSIDGEPTGRVHELGSEPLRRYAADMAPGEHPFTVRYFDPESGLAGRPISVVLTVLPDPEDVESPVPQPPPNVGTGPGGEAPPLPTPASVVEPVEQETAEPEEPIAPEEPSGPAEPSGPVEPVVPVEPAVPVETVVPVEPAVPVEPVESPQEDGVPVVGGVAP